MKFLFAALIALSSLIAGAQTAPLPSSQHVFVIVEENHQYSDVINRMPYLVSLGSGYGHTLNYHANASGSLLDYLWLASGSSEKTFGCNGAGCSSPITSDNVFREINKAGLSWKSYQENLPSVGYMGSGSGLYVKRHNPAPFYSDVIASVTEQAKIVPFTQFEIDLAAGTIPNYSFITPNLVNDAHNRVGTVDVRLETADAWLQKIVPKMLASKYFQPGGDGVLFITFDECDGASTGVCGGNPELVYTAVISPKVRPGSTTGVLLHHENTLRTMMQLLGLTTFPGAAATAVPMSDLFNPDGLKVIVPRDGAAQLSSPVRVHATDQRATRIEVWIDRVKRAEAQAQELNTLFPMAPGTHRVAVVGVEGSITTKIVESITVIQ